MKSLSIRILGLSLAGLVSLTAWANSLESSCYQAIRSYSSGPFECDFATTLNIDSVLFQGDQGLFLLMDNSACFYRFPFTPVDGKENDFYMKLEIPSVQPLYTSFQTFPDQYPALGWSPAALPGLPYEDAVCESTTDPSSVAAIKDFLAAKISTAPHRYQIDLGACHSSSGHCLPKQQYIDALNSCGNIGDLQPTIAKAIQQLRGLPECRCPEKP